MISTSTTLRRIGLAILLGSAAASSDARAALIFDNTSTATVGSITTVPTGYFLGDEVIGAPGTSRTVTELDFGFTSQGFAATASFQVFLYANDGTNGAPGTLLYQSGTITTTLKTSNQLIAFAIPSVVVPDTFTFAAQISQVGGSIIGFVPASAATTGTFVQAYSGSGTPGTTQAQGSPGIEGRVITSSAAVPEPSALILTGLGLAGAGFIGRKRARAIGA